MLWLVKRKRRLRQGRGPNESYFFVMNELAKRVLQWQGFHASEKEASAGYLQTIGELEEQIEELLHPDKTRPPPPPHRHGLPDERHGSTHKFSITQSVLLDDGAVEARTHTFYLIVACYANGAVGEIYIRKAMDRENFAAIFDCWCLMVSLGLQCGMPLGKVIEKFWAWDFEPKGATSNREIAFCTSPVDYIVKYLDLRYNQGRHYKQMLGE